MFVKEFKRYFVLQRKDFLLNIAERADACVSGSLPYYLLTHRAPYHKTWRPDDIDFFVPCNGQNKHLDPFTKQYESKAPPLLMPPNPKLLKDWESNHTKTIHREAMEAKKFDRDGHHIGKLPYSPQHCACPDGKSCDVCRRLDKYSSIGGKCHGAFAARCDVICYPFKCSKKKEDGGCTCEQKCDWEPCAVCAPTWPGPSMLQCERDLECGWHACERDLDGGWRKRKFDDTKQKPRPFYETVVESFHHTCIQNAYDLKTKTLYIRFPQQIVSGESVYKELPHQRALERIHKYAERGTTMLPLEFVSYRTALVKHNAPLYPLETKEETARLEDVEHHRLFFELERMNLNRYEIQPTFGTNAVFIGAMALKMCGDGKSDPEEEKLWDQMKVEDALTCLRPEIALGYKDDDDCSRLLDIARKLKGRIDMDIKLSGPSVYHIDCFNLPLQLLPQSRIDAILAGAVASATLYHPREHLKWLDAYKALAPNKRREFVLERYYKCVPSAREWAKTWSD